MITQIFSSTFGRWVAPAALAAATFCGTLGVSSVASADEVVRVGVAPRVVVAAPRVVVAAPGVRPRVVVEPGAVVGAPYYYGYGGPVLAGGYYPGYYGYGRGWGYGGGWGGYGRGGFGRGGAAPGAFHGGAPGGGGHGGHR